MVSNNVALATSKAALLNTAAVLVVAGQAADFRAGAALAAAAIDDGRAATLLENLRAG